MTETVARLLPVVQEAANRLGIEHKILPCDPNLADTAAFCDSYGYPAEQTCNAIIVASKTEPVKYACCVVLANSKLDVNKTVCKLLDVKRCSFAGAEQTLALTGMEIGGVTPVGLPAEIPVFIDAAVRGHGDVVLGGGNRSSKLVLDPDQLLKVPGLQFVENLGLPR